jgi:hypothetical protein
VVVAGAFGLTLCDLLFHVQTGTLHYESPVWFEQAWWVPLTFAAGTLWFYSSAWFFAWRLPAPPARALVTGTVWFVAAYAASGVLHRHPWALLGGLAVAFAGRLAFTARPALVAAYAILLGITGCLGEGVLAATGLFAYSQEHVFNVPLWLFGLYLHGAPLALALAARFGACAPEGNSVLSGTRLGGKETHAAGPADSRPLRRAGGAVRVGTRR